MKGVAEEGFDGDIWAMPMAFAVGLWWWLRGAPVATGEAREQAHSGTRSVNSFIEWLAEHEAAASIVVLTGPDAEVAVAHRPGEPRPLASVRKVLVLGAYADGVATGSVDPAEQVPLAEVDRWWVPGTDGGAHESAIEDLGDNGWLVEGSLPLDRVVWAMVRWSDNAAADYLFERLGADQVATFAAEHGVTSTRRLTSTFGELISWSEVPFETWQRMSPDERVAHSAAAASTRRGPLRDLRLPGVDEQRRFARTSTTGTAGEWAQLMARVGTGRGFDQKALEIVRRHLEWPLEAFPPNRTRFDQFATKGGSLPGVLTEASFVRPTGGELVAMAFFLDDIDLEDWGSLTRTFVHQQLLVELAEDPATRRHLANTLDSRS